MNSTDILRTMMPSIRISSIDGTKFEANANKMTFVWMKATKNTGRKDGLRSWSALRAPAATVVRSPFRTALPA